MRYVLLDRITALEPPRRATALKCVSLAEDVFADHFPGLPVMPGALVLESLAQLGGVLVEAAMRERGREDLYAVLAGVDRARFRHLVRPGDQLELETVASRAEELGAVVSATARVGGKVAVEAEITFAFVQLTNARVIAQRKELLEVWLSSLANSAGAGSKGPESV